MVDERPQEGEPPWWTALHEGMRRRHRNDDDIYCSYIKKKKNFGLAPKSSVVSGLPWVETMPLVEGFLTVYVAYHLLQLFTVFLDFLFFCFFSGHTGAKGQDGGEDNQKTRLGGGVRMLYVAHFFRLGYESNGPLLCMTTNFKSRFYRF